MVDIGKIIYNKEVLAIYVRSDDWQKGLNFISHDEDSIQVGLWYYESGKKLGPHKHIRNERQINITQEMIFVKKGRVRSSIYSENNDLVETVDLNAGDLMILFSGGHGYRILENDTQVLEVKNGPYTGLEDRVPFDEKLL